MEPEERICKCRYCGKDDFKNRKTCNQHESQNCRKKPGKVTKLVNEASEENFDTFLDQLASETLSSGPLLLGDIPPLDTVTSLGSH